MQDHLCITVRFLGGAFHGRADRGEPEWPPSPLRLFQALIAAGAAHWNERSQIQRAAPALHWLEAQAAPVVVAPRGLPGEKYRLYVPDNVADVTAGKWARGDSEAITKRSEKDVRPTHLLGGEAVHYLWSLPGSPDEFPAQRETLFATVSSITHLGWGVDMVVAHAATLSDAEAAALPGQRWRPSGDGDGARLRVPVAGTLADLEHKHAAFLLRTAGGHFAPVPPLAKFRLVSYADDSAPPRAPTAAFSLLQPDASGYRIYNPARDTMRVAGMLRHAAGHKKIAAALGWDDAKSRRAVHGHGEETRGGAHVPVDGPRIAFLPLPSLEARGQGAEVVSSTRRVLLAGMRGQSREELLDLARLLSGQELVADEPDHPVAALLARLPDSDRMAQRYTGQASVWATVTPVVLPGHDDRGKYRARLFPKTVGAAPNLDLDRQKEWLHKLDARTEALLRKAIGQAGFSAELARNAELSWRAGGFLPGAALASAYAIPQKLRRFRRLHVRIAWRDAAGKPLKVAGPLCLGGGRFVGLGLFCGLRE